MSKKRVNYYIIKRIKSIKIEIYNIISSYAQF
jgi:hypothetical protein